MQSTDHYNTKTLNTPSATEFVDFSDYCRLCMQLPAASDLLDMQLIYDEDECLSYYDCFSICTKMDIRAGGAHAPHQLCKSCGLELQVAYDFYKKVEESKKFLQQLEKNALSNNKTNIPSTITTKHKSTEEITNTLQQQQQTAPESCENQILVTEEISLKYEDSNLLTPMNEGNEDDTGENAATYLNTSMEYETLEDHIDFDDYQSVDALLDEDAETVQAAKDETLDVQFEIQEFNSSENGESVIVEMCNNQSLSPISITNCITETHNTPSSAKDNQKVKSFEYESDDINSEPTKDIEQTQPAKEQTQTAEELKQSTKEQAQPTEKRAQKGPVQQLKIIPSDIATVVITKTGDIRPRQRFSGKQSCDYCNKIFKCRSRMLAHRRSHEPDERPKFNCEECGRLYMTKQARNLHMNTAHQGAGVTCDVCGKLFAVKNLLEIHMRYHTGDFPYVCDLCGRKFAQMCHLNTHKNVRHNSERYTCVHPGCGKFFTSSASLRNHEFLHGEMPFECNICRRGYPSKSKLKVHIRQTHNCEITLEDAEGMRKFHMMRAKLNLVKITKDD